MFHDKINQIPFCIWLFPASTTQATNSLYSESNFHEQIKKFTRQLEFPHAMASGRVEFSISDEAAISAIINQLIMEAIRETYCKNVSVYFVWNQSIQSGG